MLNLEIAVKKGTTYSLLLIALVLPFSIVILFEQKIFFDVISYRFSLAVLILFISVAVALPKLKDITTVVIEKIIFKEQYNYYKTLDQLSKAMVSILDIKRLLKNLLETISTAMNIKKASILLLAEKKEMYTVQASHGLGKEAIENMKFSQNEPFFHWLKEKNTIVVRKHIERSQDKELKAMVKMMKLMKSDICFPFIIKDRLIGVGNISKGKNRYTPKDFKLFSILSNQAAIAIENAKLCENLRRSNVKMRYSDKLASLGILTAGLAHEIRNPLVTIKTFLQLLPERSDDEEFNSYFLTLARDELERIYKIVEELRTFSCPNKPVLQLTNINSLIDKMLLLVSTTAKKDNITIKRKFSKNLPTIRIDQEQIKQVLINLFINGIQAMEEKGGELFIETFLIFDFNTGRNCVQIEIKDNGIGIEEKDIEDLFNPFFTKKTTGTGLGLSIAHQIIKEHKGFIDVESEPDKGAIFCVTLPVDPDSIKRMGGSSRGKEKRNHLFSQLAVDNRDIGLPNF